jgi:hypothetical protein
MSPFHKLLISPFMLLISELPMRYEHRSGLHHLELKLVREPLRPASSMFVNFGQSLPASSMNKRRQRAVQSVRSGPNNPGYAYMDVAVTSHVIISGSAVGTPCGSLGSWAPGGQLYNVGSFSYQYGGAGWSSPWGTRYCRPV